MRKALKRAAHVLVAAGTLSLAHPVIAQTSATSSTFSTKPLPSGGGTGLGLASGSATSQGKMEELQVELALLGNPGTFAYSLVAKHTGANVELCGFVPSHAIKSMAVEIARKHCTVPVVDKLQLNATVSLRAPAATKDELRQGATTFLSESFGEGASELEAKANTEGVLVLKGSCDSYEQQVEISKKFRALHGCCAVDNQLTVRPVMREGRLVTLVTNDGSITLSAGSLPITPVQTVKIAPDTRPLRPVKYELPAMPQAATGQPTTSASLAVKTDDPATLTMKTEMPAGFKVGDPLPQLPSPGLAMKSAVPPPAAPDWAVGATTKIDSLPASRPVLQPVAASETTVKSTSPSHSGQWPPAHESRTVQVAYETSGVVLFDEDPTLPEPPAALAKATAQTLKYKIAAVCGAKAKDVNVEAKADGGFLVHVASVSAKDEEALTNMILVLPEMASPNVKLDFVMSK